MPSTIDVTPQGVNSNSYTTVAKSDTYFDDRLFSTKYTAASADDKTRSLIWATSILDFSMDWKGSVRTLEQRLRWPRSGVLDADGDNIDFDIIPRFLEEATSELALFLLTRDRSVEPEILGIGMSQASIGSLRTVIDPKMVLQLIPDHVLILLEVLGELKEIAEVGGRSVATFRV